MRKLVPALLMTLTKALGLKGTKQKKGLLAQSVGKVCLSHIVKSVIC